MPNGLGLGLNFNLDFAKRFYSPGPLDILPSGGDTPIFFGENKCLGFCAFFFHYYLAGNQFYGAFFLKGLLKYSGIKWGGANF